MILEKLFSDSILLWRLLKLLFGILQKTWYSYHDHAMNHDDHTKKPDCHAVIMACSWSWSTMIMVWSWHGRLVFPTRTGKPNSICSGSGGTPISLEEGLFKLSFQCWEIEIFTKLKVLKQFCISIKWIQQTHVSLPKFFDKANVYCLSFGTWRLLNFLMPPAKLTIFFKTKRATLLPAVSPIPPTSCNFFCISLIFSIIIFLVH